MGNISVSKKDLLMHLKLPQSLHSRIILLICLSALPPLAVALYAAHTERVQIEADALDSTLKLSRFTSHYQSGLIQGTQELLLTLGSTPVISAADWTGCSKFLSKVLEQNGRYSNIGVANMKGDVVCSAVDLTEPINVADRRYFREVINTNKPSVGNYHIGRVTGVPSIGIAAPVYDGAKRLNAVVYAAIRLDTLSQTLENVQLPNQAVMMIFDRNRSLLIQSSDSRNAEWLIEQSKQLLLKNSSKSKSGTQIVKHDGSSWVFSWSALNDVFDRDAMSVFVAAPMNTVIAESRKYYLVSLGMMFIGSLFLFAVALFGSHLFVMKGVRALINATNQIARGQFDVKVKSEVSHGELGELAEHIENMASEINAHLDREKEYRYLFQRNPNPMWITAASNLKYLAVNDAAILHYGYSIEEFFSMSVYDLLTDEERVRAREFIAQSEGEVSGSSVWIHTKKSGERIIVETTIHPIVFQGISALIVSLKDITSESAAKAGILDRDEQIRTMLESTSEAICGLDLNGVCTFANPAMKSLLGYRRVSQLVGQNILSLARPCDHEGKLLSFEQSAMCQAVVQGKKQSSDNEYFQNIEGIVFPVEYRTHPMFKNGELVGSLLTFDDISQRKANTDALRYLADHDSLTGLPNRRYLHSIFSDLFAPSKSGLMLLIDLDGFKDVNDTLGHQSGDMLLVNLSVRLKEWADGKHVVARLGGDEFAILAEGYDSETAARGFAAEVLQLIQRPFEVNGMRIQISASIGIAMYPAQADKSENLLRFSDVAMYKAKRTGSSVAVYDPSSDINSAARLELLSDLHQAIEHNQLILNYQPKVFANDKKLLGFEALIRWKHPQKGLIPPSEFIPLIELTSLIRPFTQWVLEAAIKQCAAWNADSMQAAVAVNISTRNLLDLGLIEHVDTLLEKYALSPNLLELEITESALMVDPDRSLEILKSIHSRGIRLAIDDFGTGYSSLSYLQKLPIDVIKIDQSFIRQLSTDANTPAIVASMISLSHSLNIQVVAEGVEDQTTFNQLAKMGCDILQGYFIARPMGGEMIQKWQTDWFAAST